MELAFRTVALAAGADSIEHGTMPDEETLKLFKQAGAYYVPTLSTINGYKERLAANPNAYPPAVLEKVKWRLEVTGKALEMGRWRLEPIDLRGFGIGKHRNVDDTPAGGGAGMVAGARVTVVFLLSQCGLPTFLITDLIILIPRTRNSSFFKGKKTSQSPPG